MKGLTIKSLSQAPIGKVSVWAFKAQAFDIREALLKLSDQDIE